MQDNRITDMLDNRITEQVSIALQGLAHELDKDHLASPAIRARTTEAIKAIQLEVNHMGLGVVTPYVAQAIPGIQANPTIHLTATELAPAAALLALQLNGHWNESN